MKLSKLISMITFDQRIKIVNVKTLIEYSKINKYFFLAVISKSKCNNMQFVF
jgi:hypothetical protein